MPAGYTQSIEDAYWSYADRVMAEVKTRIENIDESATAAQWRSEFEEIGREETCSARFFVMSFLEEQAATVTEEGFDFAFHKKLYHFGRVTAEHAFHLPDDERNQYIKLLTMIAAENNEDDPSDWKPLIWRVMLRNKSVRLLTRSEAFALGHGLHMNLKQLEKLLLCAMDNDGLSFNRSEDLIEAFCFLHGPANDIYTAAELKHRYQGAAEVIPKTGEEERPERFTASISLSLPELVKAWDADADHETTELFMDWLLTQAAHLDLPGRTARRIYRRLAWYAAQLTRDPEAVVYEEDFTDDIMEHCESEAYDPPADADPYVMAGDMLYYASLEFDNSRKLRPELTWRYMTVDEDGRVTARAIGERMPALLMGETEVTKADLLFLLWYACDLFWVSSVGRGDEILLYDRISGFWTLAEELLDMALLPRFYAPHLLERSFLTAICAQTQLPESPFEIYESMCEYILPEKQTRVREKKADEKATKAARKALEARIRKDYVNGEIDLEGIREPLLAHLLSHGAVRAQYVFKPEGICLMPNPNVAIPYPSPETGGRFDQERGDYRSDEAALDRFRLVYGLALAMIDGASAGGYHCDFRVNYNKNVSLTVLEWEPL